jgi:hypothetical protein
VVLDAKTSRAVDVIAIFWWNFHSSFQSHTTARHAVYTQNVAIPVDEEPPKQYLPAPAAKSGAGDGGVGTILGP